MRQCPKRLVLGVTILAVTAECLGDEITEIAAHLDAGTFQLLELIYRFDEEGGWHGSGIHSCAHWLNWKYGMNICATRERVRVARALPDLP